MIRMNFDQVQAVVKEPIITLTSAKADVAKR